MSDILTNAIPLALYIAIALDIALGDPVWRYHPVRIIGRCTSSLERAFRKGFPSHQRLAGVMLTSIIVGGTFVIAEAMLAGFSALSPWLGLAVNSLGIYAALAFNALGQEGRIIREYLEKGAIVQARERVTLIVSRDMRREEEQGIIRATLETVTENINDGVIAPLFFAMLGGAPLALAYKAVNTLDSMIGYRTERYRDFGWFAARLDDIVNLIPARITGFLLVVSALVLGKHPIRAVRAWLHDAQKGPSPNGGIPIVTFAGALDLRLGGTCWSREGERIVIPHVGGRRALLSPKDIAWANAFLYTTTTLFVLLYFTLALT